MNLYIGRESSKLWKRVYAETTTEIILLAENWKYLLGGLVCQYIHGLAARGVHYIHRPGPVLQDVGFYLLPELGPDRAYLKLPDRTNVAVSTLLPLSTKDRDTKPKDENHKLINGNSGDPADRRLRTQVNGKILEEGNAVHINASLNGGT